MGYNSERSSRLTIDGYVVFTDLTACTAEYCTQWGSAPDSRRLSDYVISRRRFF